MLIELLGSGRVTPHVRNRALTKNSLAELERCIWEFDRWILAQKTIMQATECLVLLIYRPSLAIKFDLNHVLCVSSMVEFVLNHASCRDRDLQRYFEEDASLTRTILCALLHMVNECFTWEEHAAEFALHRNCMLKNALVNFD